MLDLGDSNPSDLPALPGVMTEAAHRCQCDRRCPASGPARGATKFLTNTVELATSTNATQTQAFAQLCVRASGDNWTETEWRTKLCAK